MPLLLNRPTWLDSALIKYSFFRLLSFRYHQPYLFYLPQDRTTYHDHVDTCLYTYVFPFIPCYMDLSTEPTHDPFHLIHIHKYVHRETTDRQCRQDGSNARIVLASRCHAYLNATSLQRRYRKGMRTFDKFPNLSHPIKGLRIILSDLHRVPSTAVCSSFFLGASAQVSRCPGAHVYRTYLFKVLRQHRDSLAPSS